LTDRSSRFLDRHLWREQSRELTQQIVLGYGIALLLIMVGAYKVFLKVGAWDAAWRTAMWLGVAAAAATIVTPLVWAWPQRLLRGVGNALGHILMSVVLTAVYFLAIWPVGALLRALKGTHPIYAWNPTPAAGMEGWSDKKFPYDLPASQRERGRSSRRTGLLKVLVFFARRGYVIFIPVLIVSVSFGIVLFFLKTSALAPFIYTLF
jgi:hypothetical protein